MKKLLNISVVAALAILPFAANAAPVAGDPTHDDSATAASANPGYALAQAEGNDGNLATAGYVKGAYNAAIKAINKVATTAGSAVKGVQVNGADLSQDANGKVNVTVATGTANGSIKVNGTEFLGNGIFLEGQGQERIAHNIHEGKKSAEGATARHGR